MKYKVSHITKYTYDQAVPVSHNLVHLAPRQLPHQHCDNFQLMVHPDPVDLAKSVDYFGNEVAYFSIDHAHQGLTVSAASNIRVEPQQEVPPTSTVAWEDVVHLPANHTRESLAILQFVYPSPNIRLVPGVKEYASESFTAGRPVLDALIELTRRVHEDFAYDPRATTVHTPIEEVFEAKHGVCQDFAHLQIACLRSLGLPARYVSGYLRTIPPPGKPRLVGADASHAWLSAYCGEAGWIDVDPTNAVLVGTDHITTAWGRDYSDVCPIQGVIVGGGQHRMNVSVDIEPIDEG